ncbi:MAG: DUF1801 domain-containing protein [Coriobacteriia bacterium]|nr:DUF1801 domain-containing protein [Coriobacteriia bacterium]
MSNTSVQQHLSDLGDANPEFHELVQRVRGIVLATAPDASESVMYGGLMFAAPVQFCGVFAYGGHVSLEFSRGFELQDRFDVLEGSGKLRRHIKLREVSDTDSKHVREYVMQAHDLMLAP